MAIPTTLHQIWNTAWTPDRFTALRETWRQRNPHWSFRLWTHADLEQLVRERYPDLLDMFLAYPEVLYRADLGRYLVLETFGGVYADLDAECLRPLDPLLEGASLLFGLEPDEHLTQEPVAGTGLRQVLGTAFIASVPGHPFWARVRAAACAVFGTGGVARPDRPVPDQPRPPVCSRLPDVSLGASAAQIYPFTKDQCWDGDIFDLEVWERLTREAFITHFWIGSGFRHPTPIDGLPWTFSASVSTAPVAPLAYDAPPAAMKISCLTVAQDDGEGLDLAIESFRRQTHPNKELIVIRRTPSPQGAAGTVTWLRPNVRLVTETDPSYGAASCWPWRPVLADGDLLCRWAAGRDPGPEAARDPARGAAAGRRACVRAAPDALLGAGVASARHQRRRPASEDPDVASVPGRGGGPGGFRCPRGARTEAAADIVRRSPPQPEAVRAGRAPSRRPGPAPGLSPGGRPRPGGRRGTGQVAAAGEPGAAGVHVPASRSVRRRGPKVIILTPIKDARRHLPRYFELVSRLAPGETSLSLAFLEGDSRDGTYEALLEAASSLAPRFERLEIRQHHEAFEFEGLRSAPSLQLRRRAVIARARNRLLAASLGDADWALWLDADLADYPPDLLLRLLAPGKDIVMANCVAPDGAPFDLGAFAFTDGRDGEEHLLDGLYQPPPGVGRRYLTDFPGESLVRVDSVGGTALLIRGDLHREGLIFPPYSYRGYIETEGLGFMARDMGYECWGLPDLTIVHVA